MWSTHPVVRSLPCLPLALVLLAPAAHARAPGANDPGKLVKKLDKALDGRQWEQAADLCVQGLEMVARGSEWDQRWGGDSGVEMRLLWEETLRRAFDTTIEYGNRKRDRIPQVAALEMATLYLDHWPEHGNSYEMMFQKGEVAWLVREYRTSAEAYEAIYEMNARSGRRRYEAAAGWVGALWIDAGDDWEFFDSQAAEVRTERLDYTDMIARHQPIDLRDSEIELLEALDAFIAAAPDHDKAREVLYRTAHMHYTRYQARDGVIRCIAFLQGYPGHEYAPWVARMLTDFAEWSERSSEVQLRAKAMGLNWEQIEQEAQGVGGSPPAPFEPERLELFPRDY